MPLELELWCPLTAAQLLMRLDVDGRMNGNLTIAESRGVFRGGVGVRINQHIMRAQATHPDVAQWKTRLPHFDKIRQAVTVRLPFTVLLWVYVVCMFL